MNGRLRQAIEDLIYNWEMGLDYKDINESVEELRQAMEEEWAI